VRAFERVQEPQATVAGEHLEQADEGLGLCGANERAVPQCRLAHLRWGLCGQRYMFHITRLHNVV
jgi:hypothetical protein